MQLERLPDDVEEPLLDDALRREIFEATDRCDLGGGRRGGLGLAHAGKSVRYGFVARSWAIVVAW